jgi:hypothetical protein
MWRSCSAVAFVVLLASCGNSGIEQTLQWEGSPRVDARSASGVIRNTTSHAVELRAKSMRLLDADGKKVSGRFRVQRQHVGGGGTSRLVVTWRSGDPVRIDYGAGTLPLGSG